MNDTEHTDDAPNHELAIAFRKHFGYDRSCITGGLSRCETDFIAGFTAGLLSRKDDAVEVCLCYRDFRNAECPTHGNRRTNV